MEKGNPMLRVSLPDGSSREVDNGSTAHDLATSISHGLARSAVAAVINGETKDLHSSLSDQDQVQILTKHDSAALEILRHSAAHMMADAISSVAIVVGALIMAATNWRWIDPVLSIGIAGVILAWAWGLFRDTTRILMEVAPTHVNTHDVEQFALGVFPLIVRLDRVRIWSITEDVTAFSAAVVLRSDASGTDAQEIRGNLAERLQSHFGFTDVMDGSIEPDRPTRKIEPCGRGSRRRPSIREG